MKWEGINISRPDSSKRKLNPDQKRKGDYSGQFKRTRDKGQVPDPDSCRHIQKTLKGGNVLKWRNHPYWPLLCNHLADPSHIQDALKCIHSKVRHSIWSIPFDTGDKRFSPRSEISSESLEDVSRFCNFDALLTLTAWAKECKNGNIHRPAWQCARTLYDVFPQAICNTPHLFIRWPLLVEIYNESLWAFPESEVSIAWLQIDLPQLAQEIRHEETLARKRGVKLPPPNIVSRLNKDHYLFH